MIPLGVYINAATRQRVEGWREVPRRLPAWWYSTKAIQSDTPSAVDEPTVSVEAPTKKAAGKKQAVAEVVEDMFGFDLFFPPEDNNYDALHMPNARFLPIESKWGHCAGIGQHEPDSEFIDKNLKMLLLE